MDHDDTLADWIGDDAVRRFSKIPATDVPTVMDWVTRLPHLDDDAFIAETLTVLEQVQAKQGRYAEFKNSALHFEAGRRHRAAGHDPDCLAPTLYSRATGREAVPCSCGGRRLEGEWERLRQAFIDAHWTVTVHAVLGGAWLEIRRPGRRMALYRPYRPADGEGTTSMAYDPIRRLWLRVSPEEQRFLARRSATDYHAVLADFDTDRAATAPPYESLKVRAPFRFKVQGAKVSVPEALPVIDHDVLPTPMAFLERAETDEVTRLAATGDDDFTTAVLDWLSDPRPKQRVFLSEHLIDRTTRTLRNVHRRDAEMTQGRWGRRKKIIDILIMAGCLEKIEPPRKKTAEEKAAARAERKQQRLLDKLNRTIPAKPGGPAQLRPLNLDEKKDTSRNVAYRILAAMYPKEIAELRDAMPENKALEKLKAHHYPTYNSIRRRLSDGADPDALLAEATGQPLQVRIKRVARRRS